MDGPDDVNVNEEIHFQVLMSERTETDEGSFLRYAADFRVVALLLPLRPPAIHPSNHPPTNHRRRSLTKLNLLLLFLMFFSQSRGRYQLGFNSLLWRRDIK